MSKADDSRQRQNSCRTPVAFADHDEEGHNERLLASDEAIHIAAPKPIYTRSNRSGRPAAPAGAESATRPWTRA